MGRNHGRFFLNNDNVLFFALRCVGSKEIPGVTGKFGLGVQNEVGQRLTELSREHTGHSKHPLPIAQETALDVGIIK